MNKIVFDMDGTIVDLYGTKNWLDRLQAEDVSVFEESKPLYEMEEINNLLNDLKKSYKISVVSWSSKGASPEFCKATRKAKIQWLQKNNFPYDEVHIIKYGTNKSRYRDKSGIQILVDDNTDVRAKWKGLTINANYDIREILRTL